MNTKALQTLEFHKIIELLEGFASSEMGKEKCAGLLPKDDIAGIRILQEQTGAALSRLFRNGSVSFGSVREVRPALRRAEVGSSLSAAELLRIASLLENAGRVKSYGKKADEDHTDCLDPLFSMLDPLHSLSAEIRRCILDENEIADDASPALKQLRRALRTSGDRIHSQLISLINGSLRTYLQDSVITMRNGRYCVPVKAEYKGQVSGMIHDQSSTGATVFVEPMAIVKLNNEIREMQLQEEHEIEVILATLSGQAADYSGIIQTDLETLTELDFIFARANLAMSMNASEPVFNENHTIRLRKARHPLLDKKTAVPIDLELGELFDLLIVTGPNTGGKTVSLKTLGLLALMAQAGLHIPALERSTLPVFTEIYADIGDEQSIEQSLSTFSSHMTNIVTFLEKADENSLVLFDELGAGTDPTEGAALAMAILSFLHNQKILTMATTHYSELKIFALSTPGVENACCEFDVETLRPTYRLLIGIPGKSNAFAISGKLGLPGYIIEDARNRISEANESFEDVLTSLEESRVSMENAREELERDRSEIERLKRELSEKEARMSQTRDKAVQRANEEARRILQEAKEYADQTMRDFRKFGKNGIDVKEMEKSREELRARIARTQKSDIGLPEQRSGKTPKPSDLSIGDSVRVISMNVKGIVSTKPDSKGNLFVRMGVMRSKVNISDLELLDDEGGSAKGSAKALTGGVRMSKSRTVRPEINLLGKTVDEAIAELEKYLDDAYLSHLTSVRIIHGKGTGALRKGVHAYLRSQRNVAEFHLAEYGEGDAGVTIATFR